jgi:hypothetical protein
MEWDFSAEQVERGDIDYGLEHFRRDLAREVAANLGPTDAMQFYRTYGLIYDLCHALATGREFEQFIRGLEFDPPTVSFLESLVEPMRINAAMLGAILHRSIAGYVAGGASLDRAIEQTATDHGRIVVATAPLFLQETASPG